MAGADWALVICRGIAEGAERAILCGWWRLGVPDPAGDGCKKRASGRVLRGLLRGIGGGWSWCGGVGGCLRSGSVAAGVPVRALKIPPCGGGGDRSGRYALWRSQWDTMRFISASGTIGRSYKVGPLLVT